MSTVKLAVVLLGASLTLSAQAQHHDEVPSEQGSRSAPLIEKDPTLSLRLPTDLPAVAPANAMTPYLVPELNDRQAFAFDPASVRVAGKVMMLTITATSNSGTTTSGYYAVNCDNGHYRLLGFPSAGKWKSSTRTKWRRVLGIKRRPAQLVPLHAASCKNTELVVSSAKDLANRLQELSDRDH